MTKRDLCSHLGLTPYRDEDFWHGRAIIEYLKENDLVESNDVRTSFDTSQIEYHPKVKEVQGLPLEKEESAGSPHRYSPGRLMLAGIYIP